MKNPIRFFLILTAFGSCFLAPKTLRAEEPAPAVRPQIPFNTQNKATARTVYKLIGDIQDSEFDPATNLAAITKLQDTVSQTEFAGLPGLGEYIHDSLTMNSIRSKDLKVDVSNNDKRESLDVNRVGGKGSVGLRSIDVGANLEKSTSKKNNDDTLNGVSISSQNEVAVLDKARQQQSTSYGRLLVELKRLGFPRPVNISEIYGKWRWRCQEDAATYEFDFMPDGKVSVKLKSDKPGFFDGHGFVNKGTGEWSLDYRALTLKLDAANLAFFWKQRPLLFFKDREITSVDSEKMLLAISEDNEMKRIKAPAKR
jgi:hypothetical protein